MAHTAVRNHRGVQEFGRKHPAVKKLLNKGNFPEIHGDQVWFSSYFVMDYLRRTKVRKNANVMEVGCGWGLLGIYCAKRLDAKVVGVDADENVMPFLKLQATLNNVKIKTKVCRYENLKPKLLRKQDLIVGSDICFWDELVTPLYQLIKKAVNNNVKRIVIADPGRTPFLALAKKCEKKFGARLEDVSTKKPTKKTGYLLIIEPKLNQTC